MHTDRTPAPRTQGQGLGQHETNPPKLPTIPIPNFDGKIWEYDNFWTLFQDNCAPGRALWQQGGTREGTAETPGQRESRQTLDPRAKEATGIYHSPGYAATQIRSESGRLVQHPKSVVQVYT
ncbi:hypothetical protein COOONC_18541 [Cooperia oncophora]